MLGRSMLAYIPVNLANIIVSFGTIVILTRLLNGAEFGRYAIAMITLQFVHMGIFTWLEAAMARFQARAERDQDEPDHLKTLYISALRLSALTWALLMVGLYFIPLAADMKLVLAVALSSTCIQLFANLGMEAHRAAHRIARYSTLYTTQMLLSFSIGILLVIITPLREAAPYVGILVGVIIVLLIDLPFMVKKMKGGQISAQRVQTYLSYGLPICISLVLTYALNSADMFLIKAMMGDAAAGAYNAGYNLANRSIEVLFVWMAMAITPIAVTTLEKQGLEDSQNILRDYGATLLWLAMPAATGIALVAEPAGFLLGEPVRAQAITIMPLIAFAGVLNGMISYYAQRAFMLSARTSMFVWAMVPPVILNLALNIWLIPEMGLIGAVYATVIAYAFGLVLAIMVGRRYYPLPLPIRAFLQISLACLIMAICVYLTPIDPNWPDFIIVILKAMVGIIVYVSISLLINSGNCRSWAFALKLKIQTKLLRSPLESQS